MTYYDDFYGDFGAEAAAVSGVFIIVLLAVLFVTFAVAILFYILNAVGIYRMAKTLNISAPGLAFVPVANIYMMGRVAQEPVYGKKKLPYGWILLGLNMVTGVFSAGYFTSIIEFIEAALELGERADVGTFYASVLASSLLSSVISIVYTVFYYIALYQIFKMFNPNNATLFTVLSVIFSFLPTFFIFSCRNKPVASANNYGQYGYAQGYNPNGYNPAFGGQYGGVGQNTYYQPMYNQQGYTQYGQNPSAQQGYNPYTQWQNPQTVYTPPTQCQPQTAQPEGGQPVQNNDEGQNETPKE